MILRTFSPQKGSFCVCASAHGCLFLKNKNKKTCFSTSKILHRVLLWVEEASGLGSRISGTVAVEEAHCQNELKPTWQQDLEGLGKTIQWNISDISKYYVSYFFFFFFFLNFSFAFLLILPLLLLLYLQHDFYVQQLLTITAKEAKEFYSNSKQTTITDKERYPDSETDCCWRQQDGGSLVSHMF